MNSMWKTKLNRELIDLKEGNPTKLIREEIERNIDSVIDANVINGNANLIKMMSELIAIDDIEDPRIEVTGYVNADGKLNSCIHVHYIYIKKNMRFSGREEWKKDALRAKRTRTLQ